MSFLKTVFLITVVTAKLCTSVFGSSELQEEMNHSLSTLSRLPTEILELCIQKLDQKDIIKLMSVSKYIQNVAICALQNPKRTLTFHIAPSLDSFEDTDKLTALIINLRDNLDKKNPFLYKRTSLILSRNHRNNPIQETERSFLNNAIQITASGECLSDYGPYFNTIFDKMTKLSLIRLDFTPKTFSELFINNKNIEALNVSGNKLDDSFVISASKQSNLQYLDLTGCTVNGENLKSLSLLKSIKTVKS